MIYKRSGHWHLDVTIQGVRYREALNTTDRRQAKELEKDRIAQIKQGKGASKTGREFARKPFSEVAEIYLAERKPHVSVRTIQFERERLKPLCKYFGELVEPVASGSSALRAIASKPLDRQGLGWLSRDCFAFLNNASQSW